MMPIHTQMPVSVAMAKCGASSMVASRRSVGEDAPADHAGVQQLQCHHEGYSRRQQRRRDENAAVPRDRARVAAAPGECAAEGRERDQRHVQEALGLPEARRRDISDGDGPAGDNRVDREQECQPRPPGAGKRRESVRRECRGGDGIGHGAADYATGTMAAGRRSSCCAFRNVRSDSATASLGGWRTLRASRYWYRATTRRRRLPASIADFRDALPGCIVFVYDNRSTDGTGDVARAAGAVVRGESRPGKGMVVRRMFADVDADVYVIVDGDATYDASRAPEMVAALVDGDLDIVTGVRDDEGRDAAYRRGHRLGNRAFNALLGMLFGERPERHALRLSRAVAALRQVVPADLPRLRDRDRTHRARAGAAAADGGNPHPLLRASGRVGEQAVHVSRRAAHPRDDGATVPRREAAAVLRRLCGAVRRSPAWPSVPASSSSTWQTGLVPRLPTAVLATGLMLLAALSLDLRPHPRQCRARPARGKADGVSRRRQPRPRRLARRRRAARRVARSGERREFEHDPAVRLRVAGHGGRVPLQSVLPVRDARRAIAVHHRDSNVTAAAQHPARPRRSSRPNPCQPCRA